LLFGISKTCLFFSLSSHQLASWMTGHFLPHFFQ
jgi:hypothetical protein